MITLPALLVLAILGSPAPAVASPAASLALSGPESISVCTAATVPEIAATSPELEALYRSGVRFADFLAGANRRKAMWDVHYGEGSVSADHVARAQAIPGTWHILAVAEDWCSDSVNTIPYLARLDERVDGIEMRIIDSEAGRELMDAHRTPDGRASTPTVLILDENYEIAGCFIERPAPLQTWALAERAALGDEEFLRQKMAWYAEDGGASTVDEIVDILEAAARGERICG